MVLVLALDTSTPAVTAGLVAFDDGAPRLLAERVTINPRAHGELLTPHVLDVLAESDHVLDDVSAIVVGSGPGPFTGLRAGMVTAAALGHATGIPVHPVCGLDAMAAGVAGSEPLLVAADARRKEVYWATYDADRRRLTGPHVNRPDEVGLDGATSAAGELADRHRDVFGLPVTGPTSPTPVGLVLAAREQLLSGAEPEPLVPMYLRRPDAAEPGPRKQVSPGGANA